MNKVFFSFIISLIIIGCTDPNMIGLEVQPPSDLILIDSKDFEDLNSKTESEDSLRADGAESLILGQIEDPEFELNSAFFYTQILLKENNVNLGSNPVVDSVILSYTYSDYYGELEEFTNLEVKKIEQSQDIFKDSIYYTTFDLQVESDEYFDGMNLSIDLDNPFLRIKLKNEFGQQLLKLGEEGNLIDNEIFLQNFKGIKVFATSEKMMIYLNPEGSKSYLKVYYHNDESGTDTLSLDFDLGGDAARINCFNQKNESSIIQDNSRIYIQSMAGYKAKISINNIDSINSLLDGKVINKVIMSFDIEEGSQNVYYPAHDQLFLSRVKEDGTYLSTFQTYDIGVNVFVSGLEESNKYDFNITQYFVELLNNPSYTNELYLLSVGAAINANRTILNKDIRLEIYYSEL